MILHVFIKISCRTQTLSQSYRGSINIGDLAGIGAGIGERGREGERERVREGERERGRVGEWESGRDSEGEGEGVPLPVPVALSVSRERGREEGCV
jgi:hypothetical protein